MSIQIAEFNAATMKPHRIILVVGKRGTGKSTLIKDLMYHLRDKIDFPLAITPTQDSQLMFESHMPETCVHTSWSPRLLTKLIELQRKNVKKNRERHILFVLDDMMFDKTILKGQAIRDLAMNGRHLKVSFINAMQYLMDMGPDIRSQVDYCFALRENIPANRVKLYKFFFGGFATYQDFCTVFDACTENNECIVIDNTIKSNNVADMVFWYKANLNHPPFLLGDERLWRSHYKYFRTEEEIEKLRDKRGNPIEGGGKALPILSVSKACK